jgi:hypothetical protein
MPSTATAGEALAIDGTNDRPRDKPFGTRLSPMSQVRSVTHVFGPDKA